MELLPLEQRRIRPLGGVDRCNLGVERSDVILHCLELGTESIHELLQRRDVGCVLFLTSRDLCFHLIDGAIDQYGHLVARHRAVALELAVGIAFDQTIGGERLDGLVRPAVSRNVREWVTALRNGRAVAVVLRGLLREHGARGQCCYS